MSKRTRAAEKQVNIELQRIAAKNLPHTEQLGEQRIFMNIARGPLKTEVVEETRKEAVVVPVASRAWRDVIGL
jgi:hypothetical protein